MDPLIKKKESEVKTVYIRVRVKNALFRKKTLGYLLFGVLLSVLLIFLRQQSLRFKNYGIAIEDSDRSEQSKRLISALKEMEGFDFDKAPDVTYRIRPGYAKKFKEGKLEGILELVSSGLFIPVGILNDKIGSEIVKQYIYYDLFLRLNEKRQTDLKEYETMLRETKSENEILSLQVIKEGRTEKSEEAFESDALSYEKYVFLFFLFAVGFSLNRASFLWLFSLKEQGLRQRMKREGIGEASLFVAEGVANGLLFSVLFLLLFVSCSEIGVETAALGVIVVCLSFFLGYLIERAAFSEVMLQFLSTVMFLLLGGSGLLIRYLKF